MIPKTVIHEAAPDALAAADELRTNVNREILDEQRSEFGQFMTPAPVARFMASMFAMRGDSIRLLDPGAAVGSLTAAFIDEACGRKNPPREIEVTAFEVDSLLASKLEQTLMCCRAKCMDYGISFTSTVVVGDFIESMVSRLTDGMFAGSMPRFSHVIMNPPYRKIRSDSSTRRSLTRAGIETTNLYSAFMALAVKAMEPEGEFVSITPRSFCNGPYFRSFRRAFVRAMALSRFHLFNSRKEAFRDDEVLQESIITYAVRPSGKRPAAVMVSSSDGPDAPSSTNRLVPYDTVVRPGDNDSFIHLIVDDQNATVADKMRSLSDDLTGLRLTVSTGRVVDFRATEFICDQPNDTTVPLIYPCNLQQGRIEWPKDGQRKPQAIIDSGSTANLLIESGYYVLVKRFSAKEERRRVVAAVFDPTTFPFERIGIENHLNYYHCNGHGMSAKLANGLSAFLNCSEVDTYFRQFNGHTQVNASDLRKLHYPTVSQLEAIGHRILQCVPTDQHALDLVVSSEIGWEPKA